MIWRVILFWLIGMSFVRADLPRHPSVAAVAFCNSPYVYDGPLVIHERDTNNNPQVTYTRGLDLSLSLRGAGGIGGLLARTDSNGPACYHSDGNGNITALIDADQYVAARYEYDPYGRLIGKWGRLADANRYRFSSKEFQPASGLYYYGYRFYEPNFGRWLNRDPIQERGGLNLYSFNGNNPANRIDPLGLFVSADPNDANTFAQAAEQMQLAQEALQLLQWLNQQFADATRYPGTGVVGSEFEGAFEGALQDEMQAAVDNLLNNLAKAKPKAPCPDKSPSTPVGRRGQPANVAGRPNTPGTVNGLDYSGHAFDQMQARGITPSVVQDAIANGTAAAGDNGATVYTTSQAQVVVSSTGKVITVIPQ
jgi:RHS repeat-associated protein